MTTIVYTMENCPNCILAKQLLSKNRIDYEERSLIDPDAMTELNIDGIFPMSAPVVKFKSSYHLTVQSLEGAINECC